MTALIARFTFWRFNQILLAGLVMISWHTTVQCQESAKEEDFFKINKVRSPEGTILEVGGLCTLPNGDLAVTTRRGENLLQVCMRCWVLRTKTDRCMWHNAAS